MITSFETTQLTRVSDIEIPDVFNRRMRTGVEAIDKIFGGEGILPGMAFTVAAPPGCGKTTLLLQILEQLSENYSTGYVTGEESSVMVAYTCRRLGLTELQLCYNTEISKAIEMMADLDIIIIDSFASLTDNGVKPKEEDAISRLTAAAKANECAIGVVLHYTKGGKFRGSNSIPHTVDCNVVIEVDPENTDLRNIFTTKNRYGCLYDGGMTFTSAGYDFEATIDGAEYKTLKAQGKKTKMDCILDLKEPPHITVDRVVSELNVAEAYARQMLYKLSAAGKLIKYGTGPTAVWKFPVPVQVEVTA